MDAMHGLRTDQLRPPGGIEQDGFPILPGVFGKQEIERLINSISNIAN